MDLGLKGKCALVTGGSRGIGRSISLTLAKEGCNVSICARDEGSVESVVNEIKVEGVDSIGVSADVVNLADIDRVVEETIERWGALHILINNVGGGGRWGKECVEETEDNVWTEVYDKNAMAAVRFTMRVIPYMKKQKWGRVVTVASVFGREGGGRPWFNMAKSAEISLMKTLAMNYELVRSGITFNSVAPGGIMIPGTGWEEEQKNQPKEFEEKVTKRLPLGRLGTPEEVADVVVFICSEQAGFVNGACVAVDGGESRSF